MSTAPLAHDDTLVLDYLAALWAASDDLPPATRDDLMTTVSGYIAMRHDLAGDPSRALTRLGPPEQLVAAVRRSGTPTHLRLPVPSSPTSAPPAGPRGADRAAVALLAGGAFVLPFVAPGAALLIAAGSPRWSPAQKAAACLLVTGPVAGTFLFILLFAGGGVFTGLGLILLYLASCAGSVAAGLTLRETG
ncbi:HAAS signaling domain-containing protein [Actinoplanes utahensis]|uniref:Uncharacterized protein n=1 Tax=Actinoplanes utahensis TaxID=1869 RepID=A0A0A6WX47_ACTUT|nr:hypothetical protein [Actinoplanes utahensis]KHD72267.1 hypothetical protein MB27_41150 [Actinoplanes utahensis]GIF35549.1 hypothetical protein Aut01nite_85350 [Actinoplanes utahensis]